MISVAGLASRIASASLPTAANLPSLMATGVAAVLGRA
jgi:hypothetical protein